MRSPEGTAPTLPSPPTFFATRVENQNPGATPENVKLLLPTRQCRGFSRLNRKRTQNSPAPPPVKNPCVRPVPMKHITVSVTDLQHCGTRIWDTQRNGSTFFIARRVLEDLPQARTPSSTSSIRHREMENSA